MKLLFLGRKYGNTLERQQALGALGYDVVPIYMEDVIPSNRYLKKWIYKTGGLFFQSFLRKRLFRHGATRSKYYAVFLNQNQYFNSKTLSLLRSSCGPLIQYINDDPFGNAHLLAWRHLLKAIPLYSLVVVVRHQNLAEAQKMGAQAVLRVYMAAESSRHRPMELSESERINWSSDVLFVGTWFPERGPFLLELFERGVPLSIYGRRWQLAPEWGKLKSCFRGDSIMGEDYVKAIQCTKVCLGLLSKANRDEYTTRSMEIPAIGTVFCAERTPEHENLYKDGEEAIFFDDAEECAAQCLRLLDDSGLRDSVARAGRTRFLKNAHTNESEMARIIQKFNELS
ncbi:CgeB family protein [Coraliomargarita sp. W4R53]